MRGPLGVRWIYVYAISQRCCRLEGDLVELGAALQIRL